MAKKYRIEVILDDADAAAKLKALAATVGVVDRAARKMTGGLDDAFRKVGSATQPATKGMKDAKANAEAVAARVKGVTVAVDGMANACHSAFVGMNADVRAVVGGIKEAEAAFVRMSRAAGGAFTGHAPPGSIRGAGAFRHAAPRPPLPPGFANGLGDEPRIDIGLHKVQIDSVKQAMKVDRAADSLVAKKQLQEQIGLYREKVKVEQEEARLQGRATRFVDNHEIKEQISLYREKRAAARDEANLQARASGFVDRHEQAGAIALYREKKAAAQAEADLQARATRFTDRHEQAEAVQLFREKRAAEREAASLQGTATAFVDRHERREQIGLYRDQVKAAKDAEKEKEAIQANAQKVLDRHNTKLNNQGVAAARARAKAETDILQKQLADSEKLQERALDDHAKAKMASPQRAGIAKEAIAHDDLVRRRVRDNAAMSESEKWLSDRAIAASRASVTAKMADEDKFQGKFTRALSDRQIQQMVANEKISRSDQKRVDLAMKNAGMEDNSHQKIIKSLGMMIARFMVYHMVIGKATQLVNAYREGAEKAAAAQDAMLGKFVDERGQLNRLAVQTGNVNGDAMLVEMKKMQVQSRMPFQEVKTFMEASTEGAAQYIGKDEADFGPGKIPTVTPKQNLAINAKAMEFAQLHGIEPRAAAMLLAQTIGDEDVHKDPNGADKVFRRFAKRVAILEHGVGPTPTLATEAAQFHAEYGKENFSSVEAESAFLSAVAQTKPKGNVFAAARTFAEDIQNPKGDMEKFVKRIPGFAEMNVEGKVEAIRGKLDAMGMDPLHRSAWISKHFTEKRGLSAARGLLGAGGGAVVKERLKFGEDFDVDADVKKRGATPAAALDREVAQAELNQAERVQGLSRVPEAEAMARSQLEKDGRWKSSADMRWRGIKSAATFGWAHVDDTTELRVKAQEMLLKDIGAKAPGMLNLNAFAPHTYKDNAGKDQEYVPFNSGSDPESSAAGIAQLMKIKDSLGMGAGNPGAVADPIVEAIRKNGEDVVRAINGRVVNRAEVWNTADPLGLGKAPGQNLGTMAMPPGVAW